MKDAIELLGLSERTTKKHLLNIPEVSKTKNGYKLSFSESLTKNKKSTFVLISHEKLFSYNWKNIGSFHAYLSEIEISRYKRHQKAKVKGYKVFNQKDKMFEVIKDGTNSQYHNLQSIECSSLVIKKSKPTISRYKKIQEESIYKSEKIASFDKKYTKKDGSFNFKKYLFFNKGIFILKNDSFFFSTISKRESYLVIKFG